MCSGVSKEKEKVAEREEGEIPRDRGTKHPASNHLLQEAYGTWPSFKRSMA
jgi:hypothetical protein